MKITEKIRHLRTLHGYTQENMAEMLNMSVNGYANIERGETDLTLSRIEQIAKLFNLTFLELVNNGEYRFFFLSGNNNNNNYFVNNPSEHSEEIEKLRLAIQSKDQKIEFLEKEILYQKEIINLLKSEK
ncbi:helix-turn-helix domain-containing protein [Hugenholtzia roseola]|uniref:helix-turn-helix domain-containing protein n=1 Tax=Hugenholtzia roseola TaxID=1002 RepID=UPI00047A47B2|nr:helix-turn-helix transcriptional regulator [Hugenholtzia roseola]